MADGVIEVQVSFKGKPIKSFRFAQQRISIGRDPDANVFLDNAGISRGHAILERVGNLIYVQDLDSANGTFLNEQQIRREIIRPGDKLRIGKFSLELKVDEDRRGMADPGRPQGAAYQGTVVLDATQIERLRMLTKEAEDRAAEQRAREPVPVAAGNAATARQVAHPASYMSPAAVAQSKFQIVPRAATPFSNPIAWWRTQTWGLALGFTIGLIAGVLLVRALTG